MHPKNKNVKIHHINGTHMTNRTENFPLMSEKQNSKLLPNNTSAHERIDMVPINVYLNRRDSPGSERNQLNVIDITQKQVTNLTHHNT